jgi:hypothetical protein
MNIIDRSDYKLSVKIKNVLFPADMKAIYFIGKEFDSNNRLINESTYEFFLNDEEIKKLARMLNDT